jgi:hypothetical protein
LVQMRNRFDRLFVTSRPHSAFQCDVSLCFKKVDLDFFTENSSGFAQSIERY